jgi:hypothetical protein
LETKYIGLYLRGRRNQPSGNGLGLEAA